MPESHQIQLRGPWQVALQPPQGPPLPEFRLRIRSDNDWDAWSDPIDATCRLASVAFLRDFNWPGRVPPCVELVVAGQRPQQAHLNERPLSLQTAGRRHVAQVQELLQTRNRLRLEFVISPIGDSGHQTSPLIQRVLLEIRETP
jgi:hypothetical protein